MKIGIGITHHPSRPRTLKLALRQFDRCARAETEFALVKWNPLHSKSVAEQKNLCLKHLSDCNYIFLFDDDCFPIKKGFERLFIDASERSGVQFMHALWDTTHIYHLTGEPTIMLERQEAKGIEIYGNAAGCCLFLTKKVLETIGGFDESFEGYGSEHENYARRAAKAGLVPVELTREPTHLSMGLGGVNRFKYKTKNYYIAPANVQQYIYSLDINGVNPYVKELKSEINFQKGQLKPASSIMKAKFAQRNLERLNQPITQLVCPL